MRIKITFYLDPEIERALRYYAAKHQLTISDASNHLLNRALFGALDEATEALLVPEIRKAAAAGARAALEEVITRALEKQSNRLAGLLVRSGRDARVAHELCRDILEEMYGSKEIADTKRKDAVLRAGQSYSVEHFRKELEAYGGQA